jgi:hypothetical protein
MKNIVKKLLLFTSVFVLFNTCVSTEVSKKQTSVQHPEHKITIDSVTNYHQDKEFEYEYRTGTTNHYQYNYNVIGTDIDGNEVSGNINVEGKYGKGTLLNPKGNTTDITTEWIGYGKLSATDTDGTTYELIVE